jgi:hypothetical protein
MAPVFSRVLDKKKSRHPWGWEVALKLMGERQVVYFEKNKTVRGNMSKERRSLSVTFGGAGCDFWFLMRGYINGVGSFHCFFVSTDSSTRT